MRRAFRPHVRDVLNLWMGRWTLCSPPWVASGGGGNEEGVRACQRWLCLRGVTRHSGGQSGESLAHRPQYGPLTSPTPRGILKWSPTSPAAIVETQQETALNGITEIDQTTI